MTPAAAQDRWRPTHALRRGVLLAALLPLLAVVTGRPDLLVLGAPLLVGTMIAVLLAPTPGAPAPSAVARAPRTTGQGRRVPVEVTVGLPAGAQAALVRLPADDGVPFGLQAGVARGRDSADGVVRLSTDVLLRRWGRVLLVRPDLRPIGPDALLAYPPVTGAETTVLVLPELDRPVPAPLPPRAAGAAGNHRTRRPGEGLDLLDVREFTPGDRMRRIDWRVSARRGALHVRRTAVDADADVVLALDTRLDVGARLRTWASPATSGRHGHESDGSGGSGTSLDRTVRTAASLAQAFTAQGDRVVVLDLARPRLSVPGGTGRRQLRRIVRRLAEVAVVDGANRLVLRPGTVPSGAVVLVLSPFLDEAATELAVRLARRRVHVVAVDVLPLVDPGHPVRRDEVAGRLLLAERAARLAALRRSGVQVCRGEAGAVALHLREAARRRQRVGR